MSSQGSLVPDLIEVAAGCTRCPELVSNRRCIVHGYGSTTARVFFIGEAPGIKGGDRTGVPFTRDRSGVRLQQVLIDLGLSVEKSSRVERPRLHCFVTNVVRCNPPGNRTPRRSEVANCMPYLVQELDRIDPHVVVPLGNVALRALFEHYELGPTLPITRVHAQILDNAPLIVPSRHPARISNADLDRLARVLRRVLG